MVKYSDCDTNYNAHIDPLFLYPEASPLEIFIIFKICFKILSIYWPCVIH